MEIGFIIDLEMNRTCQSMKFPGFRPPDIERMNTSTLPRFLFHLWFRITKYKQLVNFHTTVTPTSRSFSLNFNLNSNSNFLANSHKELDVVVVMLV